MFKWSVTQHDYPRNRISNILDTGSDLVVKYLADAANYGHAFELASLMKHRSDQPNKGQHIDILFYTLGTSEQYCMRLTAPFNTLD